MAKTSPREGLIKKKNEERSEGGTSVHKKGGVKVVPEAKEVATIDTPVERQLPGAVSTVVYSTMAL